MDKRYNKEGEYILCFSSFIHCSVIETWTELKQYSATIRLNLGYSEHDSQAIQSLPLTDGRFV